MAPLPAKRRKIQHGDGGETDSENGLLEPSDSNIEKPPTVQPKRAQDVDENALYSGALYNSSMFKLQIDEMLAQVQLNYEKRMPGVDEVLRRLKTLIESIENRAVLPVCFQLLFCLYSMLIFRYRFRMPQNRYINHIRSLFRFQTPNLILMRHTN